MKGLGGTCDGAESARFWASEFDDGRFCCAESGRDLAYGACICEEGTVPDDLGNGGVITIVASPETSFEGAVL